MVGTGNHSLALTSFHFLGRIGNEKEHPYVCSGQYLFDLLLFCSFV